MKMLVGLIACMLVGCNRPSGPVVGSTLSKADPIVLAPLGDAQRRNRVPVLGSGAAMTKALAAELSARGFQVTVAAEPTLDAIVAAIGDRKAITLCGNFLEWSPDLVLALTASTTNDNVISQSYAAIASSSVVDSRRDYIDDLATKSVDKLLGLTP